MDKVERGICVVCKKKRSKKYMNILPQYITEELNSLFASLKYISL